MKISPQVIGYIKPDKIILEIISVPYQSSRLLKMTFQKKAAKNGINILLTLSEFRF